MKNPTDTILRVIPATLTLILSATYMSESRAEIIHLVNSQINLRARPLLKWMPSMQGSL